MIAFSFETLNVCCGRYTFSCMQVVAEQERIKREAEEKAKEGGNSAHR